MLIDWFTVTAQIINFLILVWLLKRFLYQPILNALDAREKKINAELAAAEQQKQAAQALHDEFIQKNQAFVQEREELLHAAVAEAQAERQKLLNAARQEAEALRQQAQMALQQEQQNLISAIKQRTEKQILAITAQVLHDLADWRLEQQILTVFISQLQQLSAAEKQAMIFALANLPLRLTTAFALLPEQMQTLTVAVKQTFGSDIVLEFKTAPDLIGGIELSGNGQKIAWSIRSYLTALENTLQQILQQPPSDNKAVKGGFQLRVERE